MAIYIQQSPDEVQHSFNLQRRAEIISVNLNAASIASYPQGHESGRDLSIRVGHESKGKMMEDGALATNIEFALVASPEDDDSIRVFSIKCTFRITYQLDEGYQPTSQEIKAFAGANAVFNAWPYFREFAQNACVRMGIPATPTVPFLKLVPKAQEKTKPAGKVLAQPSATDAPKVKARKHQAKPS